MNAVNIENAKVFLSGREILHNINWQVKRGERCFILGANGAGKTTLVRMLMGYAWPVYGATVEVLGHRFGTVNLQELRKRIAWVSPLMHQWLGDREWTGREMVLSGPDATIGLYRDATPEEEARAAALMESLRATHLMQRKVHTMSSGEQVKVLIARALMTNPELMILDEPSVYLDIAGREFLLHTIDELAASHPLLTIIFITQRIEDILPTFNRGMILRQGDILAYGTRDEVLTETNLRCAFDLDIRLIHARNGRLWTVIE
ncbi:MAG: ATP-binding cassette domain-containing protein [Akkermansia sp.]|nr:ATP-binding cassette domain-containing protein [Akkermansiaceae bacterium]MBR3695350.1 ATP-binding cassette domain-containing protein [Akkermansia sp.]MBR7109668.1 ATP-binding cassette domain-containing protein [Akkermansia sp.]